MTDVLERRLALWLAEVAATAPRRGRGRPRLMADEDFARRLARLDPGAALAEQRAALGMSERSFRRYLRRLEGPQAGTRAVTDEPGRSIAILAIAVALIAGAVVLVLVALR